MPKFSKTIALLFCFFAVVANAQQPNKTKVVLITLDGLRWQEMFSGADPALISNKDYVHDTLLLKQLFWNNDPNVRRKLLMPFLWGTVINMGQIHGNRNLGSKMNLTNSMWFSYPGYNEILTGQADDKRIVSNDKINNPNTTILESYNNSAEGNGKVAAFGSWDVFPYIVNEERSKVPVNAGFEMAKERPNDRELFLNVLQKQIPSPWSSVRLDAFTHHYALEYMKKNHPNLVYIAYGETDDFAHEGDYQAYLKSTNTTDNFIKELWEFTQTDDYYKNETVFIITTDHGRGTEPIRSWRDHGSQVDGADQVWLVVFGKNILPKGEIASEKQLFTNQIAPTIAKWMDFKLDAKNETGSTLELDD